MSNKHWCMPNYPYLRLVYRYAPVYKSEKPIMALYKYADFMVSKNRLHDTEPFIAEAHLLRQNSPCLFIDSKELCLFLHESTYSEGIFQHAIKQFEYKFICFPCMNIKGIDTRSCAFGRFSGIKSENDWSDIAIFTCELPGKDIDFRRWPIDELDHFLVDAPSKDMHFPKDKIAHFMLRLCMAAVVYAAAFPDYIREGLPTDAKAPALTKPRILTAAPEILEGATRTSVSMHIRAGHFKTLQHERFKRNEDGTPKIIFVRQTVVAGKLTPKTAIES